MRPAPRRGARARVEALRASLCFTLLWFALVFFAFLYFTFLYFTLSKNVCKNHKNVDIFLPYFSCFPACRYIISKVRIRHKPFFRLFVQPLSFGVIALFGFLLYAPFAFFVISCSSCRHSTLTGGNQLTYFIPRTLRTQPFALPVIPCLLFPHAPRGGATATPWKRAGAHDFATQNPPPRGCGER